MCLNTNFNYSVIWENKYSENKFKNMSQDLKKCFWEVLSVVFYTQEIYNMGSWKSRGVLPAVRKLVRGSFQVRLEHKIFFQYYSLAVLD